MSNDSSHLDIGDKPAFFNEDVHIFGKLYVHSIESLEDETTSDSYRRYGVSGGGGSTHDHATEHLNLGNLTVTGLTVNGNASITGTTTTEDMIVNDDLTVLDDASITGDLTAAKVSVTGGTSAGFLKADGTVDTNTYLTSSAAFSGFPQGTRMIFQQSTAPTGWTKDTTDTNQHALRVVSGTAGSGGSVDFTSALALKTISSNISGNSASEGVSISGNTSNENVSGNISNENVSISGNTQGRAISSSQMAQHNHVFPGDDQLANANGAGGGNDRRTGSWGYDAVSNLGGGGTIYRTSDSGNGHNHDHGISFNSGGHNHNFNSNSHSHNFNSSSNHSHGNGNYSFNTSMDLRVRYLDVIICSKD